LDLKEGEEVEINVPGSLTKKLYGLVKCWEGVEDALDEYDSNIH